MSVELVYYACKGSTGAVRQLLDDGVHSDACGSNGETALFHAALAGHTGIVKLLLKYGADPNRCSRNGLTPVNAACLNDNVTSFAQLINYGGRLEKSGMDHQEAALVSAHKHHSDRVIKYMAKLKSDARTKHGVDLLEVDIAQREEQHERQRKRDEEPGKHACITCIDVRELQTVHNACALKFTGPHVIFMTGCWHRIPVTVKTLVRKYYESQLKEDMAILSQLRHPCIASLLAVSVGPIPEHVCLVMECFKYGSLNHILHETTMEMSLPNRVSIFLDVSEAMVFLDYSNIIHCFLNSYSILVYEKYRAKICNFEYSQKIKDDGGSGQLKPIGACVEQHRWMAPEQLRGEPASSSSDVYSFGASMWECLARTLPWSWLPDDTTMEQVVSSVGTRLPILNSWPNYVRNIIVNCLESDNKRPTFKDLRGLLDSIKNSGWHIISPELEHAFEMWLEGSRGSHHSRRKSSVLPRARISRKISILSDHDLDDVEDNKIRILCSRRKSSHMRRQTLDAGLLNLLKMFGHHSHHNVQKDKDIERYGADIADQLEIVRHIRGHAKHYFRNHWAKETTVRRRLEGDLNRLKQQKDRETLSPNKKKTSKKGRRTRRLLIRESSLQRLRGIADKFDKRDWAMITTGHEYTEPCVALEHLMMDSDLEEEEDFEAAMEAGVTFVQYQGDGVEQRDIVPPECQVVESVRQGEEHDGAKTDEEGETDECVINELLGDAGQEDVGTHSNDSVADGSIHSNLEPKREEESINVNVCEPSVAYKEIGEICSKSTVGIPQEESGLQQMQLTKEKISETFSKDLPIDAVVTIVAVKSPSAAVEHSSIDEDNSYSIQQERTDKLSSDSQNTNILRKNSSVENTTRTPCKENNSAVENSSAHDVEYSAHSTSSKEQISGGYNSSNSTGRRDSVPSLFDETMLVLQSLSSTDDIKSELDKEERFSLSSNSETMLVLEEFTEWLDDYDSQDRDSSHPQPRTKHSSHTVEQPYPCAESENHSLVGRMPHSQAMSEPEPRLNIEVDTHFDVDPKPHSHPQPEPHPESQSSYEWEKPDSLTGSKPHSHEGSRPDSRTSSQSHFHTESQSSHERERSDSLTGSKPHSHEGSRPDSHTSSQSHFHTESQSSHERERSEPLTESKPHSHEGSRSESRTSSQSHFHAGSQSSHEREKSDSLTGSKPHSHEGSRPDSPTSSQSHFHEESQSSHERERSDSLLTESKPHSHEGSRPDSHTSSQSHSHTGSPGFEMPTVSIDDIGRSHRESFIKSVLSTSGTRVGPVEDDNAKILHTPPGHASSFCGKERGHFDLSLDKQRSVVIGDDEVDGSV